MCAVGACMAVTSAWCPTMLLHHTMAIHCRSTGSITQHTAAGMRQSDACLGEVHGQGARVELQRRAAGDHAERGVPGNALRHLRAALQRQEGRQVPVLGARAGAHERTSIMRTKCHVLPCSFQAAANIARMLSFPAPLLAPPDQWSILGCSTAQSPGRAARFRLACAPMRGRPKKP